MHQRMWRSLSLSLFLLLSQPPSPPPPPPPPPPRCGQVHMHPVIIKVIFSRGPNPCLWAWACVTGPWPSTHRTLTLSTTPKKTPASATLRVVGSLQLLCSHLRKELTFVIFGSCVMTSSETAEVFRLSFHLSSCQNPPPKKNKELFLESTDLEKKRKINTQTLNPKKLQNLPFRSVLFIYCRHPGEQVFYVSPAEL